MQTTYTPVQGSDRIALPGAIATGRSNPKATIEVSLKLRRKNFLPDLVERPRELMTRERLRDSYGASQSDIDGVANILGGFGLSMVDANLATRTVRFRGTVSAMEEAFQVKLFNYSHERGNYRGRVGPVRIPSELHGIVQGVFGLDNRQVARRRRHPVRDRDQARLASVPSAWYVPGELASHYNFPPPGMEVAKRLACLNSEADFFPRTYISFAPWPRSRSLPPSFLSAPTERRPIARMAPKER